MQRSLLNSGQLAVPIVLAAGLATGWSLEAAAAGGSPTPLSASATLHSVTGAGQVRLQRDRRSLFKPIGAGTALRQGDQLQTDPGVVARVRCPEGGRPQPVIARQPKGLGAICRRWPSHDWRGQQAAATLGGVNKQLPYVIQPRHSLILDSTPELRWNPVPGATTYTVVVSRADQEIWRAHTAQTSIIYAGPALRPGSLHRFRVISDTGQSSATDAAPDGTISSNLDFILIDEREAGKIRQAAAQMAQDPAATLADDLALARFYATYTLPGTVAREYGFSEPTAQTYNLTAAAIDVLGNSLNRHAPFSMLHRSLGDLYWQSGLLREAKYHYETATELRQSDADLEDWVLAHGMLAAIHVIRGDRSEAARHYQLAGEGYRLLGDARMADVIQRNLERLR